jgi:hypothetical protein
MDSSTSENHTTTPSPRRYTTPPFGLANISYENSNDVVLLEPDHPMWKDIYANLRVPGSNSTGWALRQPVPGNTTSDPYASIVPELRPMVKRAYLSAKFADPSLPNVEVFLDGLYRDQELSTFVTTEMIDASIPWVDWMEDCCNDAGLGRFLSEGWLMRKTEAGPRKVPMPQFRARTKARARTRTTARARAIARASGTGGCYHRTATNPSQTVPPLR